jgi:hypothetical protein
MEGEHAQIAIVEAVEHLRPSGKPGTGSPDDLERELSRRIEAALAVGDSNARALSAEIGAVFKKIDAGETMLPEPPGSGSSRAQGKELPHIVEPFTARELGCWGCWPRSPAQPAAPRPSAGRASRA